MKNFNKNMGTIMTTTNTNNGNGKGFILQR
ncbi:MAG: hypothetical protein [Wendovervirus sonii]|uniref:Uncharacterized protein n=1 Tax=phage Lak_Megaphage_Sonny TaxID=3109229 RepID=A0ABZ0Z604_9CAUD|nr:MAG: hypothetical protein [phage Lak_Megaphage_Sonny]